MFDLTKHDVFTSQAARDNFAMMLYWDALFELLSGVAHGVELLLYVDTGVVAALQQLLPEQLQRLEGARARVHLRTVFLQYKLCCRNIVFTVRANV